MKLATKDLLIGIAMIAAAIVIALLVGAVVLGCDEGGTDGDDAEDTDSEAETDGDSESESGSETHGGCSDADGVYTCPNDACSGNGLVLWDFIEGSEHYSSEDDACVCDMQQVVCPGSCVEQEGSDFCI